jgi:pimeloyl-ACP methyl ester carboxylesterase
MVVLDRDLPNLGLRSGDLGAVVQVYKEDGIEVEFVDASGRTEVLVTLKESDVRPISDTDLIAVRSLHKRFAKGRLAMVSKVISTIFCTIFLSCNIYAQTQSQSTSRAAAQTTAKPIAKYGSNLAVGKTFTHDGVKLYYEVYGTGEPLLLVHGNGASIASFKAQIDHFRKSYKVIAMDSRDQGRSGDSPDRITYEKMTDDLAALLDHLKIEPVNVLGWSDGGIEGLLLGIRHPAKVKKIAAMAANLNPTEEALSPEVLAMGKSMMDSIPAAAKETPQGKRELRAIQMALEEPHIDPKSLEAITAPTLVLAGDHDVIRDEHTLEIYHNIPNSQLCIFPDATHMIPYDEPARFNAAVERFFRTPFVKKDRIRDMLKSFKALKAAQQ